MVPKTTFWRKSRILTSLEVPWELNWSIFRSFWELFWHQNSEKTSSKSCAKIGVEKVMKMCAKMGPKACTNLCKNWWNSELFCNLQNLDFCCKTTVKTWFLGYRGCRNSWTNHEKSMQKSSSKNVCKNDVKIDKMTSTLEPKSSKNL